MPSHARADAIPLHDARAPRPARSSARPRPRPLGPARARSRSCSSRRRSRRSSRGPRGAPSSRRRTPSRGPGAIAAAGTMCRARDPSTTRFMPSADAGSTGARAHAFRVVPDAASPPVRARARGLHNARDVRRPPRVRQRRGGGRERVAAILPALRETARRIGARDARRTPAYVWATAASARSLAAQTALWADVEALVREETPSRSGTPRVFRRRRARRATTGVPPRRRRCPTRKTPTVPPLPRGGSRPRAPRAFTSARSPARTRVFSRGSPRTRSAASTSRATPPRRGRPRCRDEKRRGRRRRVRADRRHARRRGDAAATLDDVRAAVYAASHLGVGAKSGEEVATASLRRADVGDADAAYPCGPRGWEAPHALAAAEEEGAAGATTAPSTLRGSGISTRARPVRAALASTGSASRAPAAVTGAGGGGRRRAPRWLWRSTWRRFGAGV